MAKTQIGFANTSLCRAETVYVTAAVICVFYCGAGAMSFIFCEMCFRSVQYVLLSCCSVGC